MTHVTNRLFLTFFSVSVPRFVIIKRAPIRNVRTTCVRTGRANCLTMSETLTSNMMILRHTSANCYRFLFLMGSFHQPISLTVCGFVKQEEKEAPWNTHCMNFGIYKTFTFHLNMPKDPLSSPLLGIYFTFAFKSKGLKGDIFCYLYLIFQGQ